MIKRILKTIVALISLILAILSFLIPILPGWPLLLLAIVLISPTHGKKITDWLKTKIKGMKE